MPISATMDPRCNIGDFLHKLSLLHSPSFARQHTSESETPSPLPSELHDNVSSDWGSCFERIVNGDVGVLRYSIMLSGLTPSAMIMWNFYRRSEVKWVAFQHCFKFPSECEYCDVSPLESYKIVLSTWEMWYESLLILDAGILYLFLSDNKVQYD